MRWLIWRIRCALCKHEWSYQQLAEYASVFPTKTELPTDIRISATCNNCGWHRSYSKFET